MENRCSSKDVMNYSFDIITLLENYATRLPPASVASNAPDDDQRRTQERRLISAVSGFFSQQKNALIDTVSPTSVGSRLSLNFWREQTALLLSTMTPSLVGSFLVGASTAENQLPDELQPFVNTDIVNQEILNFIETQGLITAEGINTTTREQALRVIQDWINTGETLSSLIVRLEPIFDRKRAEMIGVTETTNAFAIGNVAAWLAAGEVVGGKVWRTARDERVCPICGPLDGRIVILNSDFTLTAGQMADSPQMRELLGDRFTPERGATRAASILRSSGSSFNVPPAHPRCRCWLQPFVSEVLFEDAIGQILGNV